MAALVRIKRCLDEDPLESLILNCKRRKPNGKENDNTEELSTVFQLAATSRQVKLLITNLFLLCFYLPYHFRKRVSKTF